MPVYIYNYIGRDNRPKKGEIIASSKNEAIIRLQGIDIEPYSLKMDINNSIGISKEIPLRELSRFYSTVGKRYASGSSIINGVEYAIEYASDIKLKTSISTLYNAMSQGRSMGESMAIAEFPERHAMAVRAMEEAGGLDETFKSLAEECQREDRMRKSIKGLLRKPKGFSIILVFLFYGAFGFMAPLILNKMLDLFSSDGIPNMVMEYHSFVSMFSENIVISTILYFFVFLIVYVTIKSEAVKRVAEKIKIIHSISERSDMASTWMRFGLMYQSAMDIRSTALMVGRSAQRSDSREFFSTLESYLQSGFTIENSVEPSGFPDYVVNHIKSGSSADDVGGAMVEMSKELFDDVDMLIDIMTDRLEIYTNIMMGLGLFALFCATILPYFLIAAANT